MILAGGTGKGLSALTRHRAKTAVPFGGNYRIIDFCLSNCVHAGLTDIAILAQYSPKSLIEHIKMGKPWDLDRKSGGVHILQPVYHGEKSNWYLGTADALFQNVDLIRSSGTEHTIVLSGDQVYTMDYSELLDFHSRSGKPVTIAYKEVKARHRKRFGMASVSKSGIVKDFREKPRTSDYQYASMGIYVFNTKYLLRVLDRGKKDIVFDILLPAITEGQVAGYQYFGYWEDIGSIQSYYSASLRLLKKSSIIRGDKWQIYTRGEDLPPAKLFESSSVENSIIGRGCRVRGKVSGSILFPGTTVEKGAVVEDCIVFSFSSIGAGSMIRKAIIDKEVKIDEKVRIAPSARGNVPDIARFCEDDRSIRTNGITVLGKKSRVNSGKEISGGTVIEPGSKVGF